MSESERCLRDQVDVSDDIIIGVGAVSPPNRPAYSQQFGVAVSAFGP